jgi:hypothetical protein
LTHNLFEVRFDAPDADAEAYALAFVDWVRDTVARRDHTGKPAPCSKQSNGNEPKGHPGPQPPGEERRGFTLEPHLLRHHHQSSSSLRSSRALPPPPPSAARTTAAWRSSGRFVDFQRFPFPKRNQFEQSNFAKSLSNLLIFIETCLTDGLLNSFWLHEKTQNMININNITR